jgi:hypothetical protein
MQGTGQSDLLAGSGSIDPPANRSVYVIEFNFDNTSQNYESIAFAYTGSAANRARFMGVVLDGEVPAGNIAWSLENTADITTSNATASATHTEDLTEHALVWDASDQGDTSTSAWANVRSLGAHTAGSVSSQLTNLMADTSYTWRIYGSNAVSEAWTLPQEFSTQLTDSQKPVFTNVVVTQDTLDVVLGWEDNSNTETEFVLLRSTNGTDFAEVATPAANAVTTTDAVPLPGQYYYRLAATNSVNSSGTDPALCVTNIEVDVPAVYHDSTVLLSSGTALDVSVFPSKAGFAGSGAYSGVADSFGDGTVAAYYFVRNGVSPALERYAHDGSDILDFPVNNMFTTSSDFDLADVWISSDPGVDFAGGGPADFGGTAETISGGYLVNGNVDVSAFSGGVVYILCGGYANAFAVSATMSGFGVSDVMATTGDVTPPSTRNIYVISFPFKNSNGQYDNLYYSYTGSASNRSRFMGVVVDATPLSLGGSIFRFK